MLKRILFIALVTCAACGPKAGWPPVGNETKPWTRWWWHGSALTKEGITAELEAYAKAGLGGVEITPIYGVKGYEDKFVPYLSAQWMDLLDHTLAEAKRLHLGVDMATGTGWPFGGPWVGDEFASRNINHKIYSLSAGQVLKEKIEFIQAPYLRTIGTESAIEQIQVLRKLPLVSITAYNNSGEVVDLINNVSADGNLGWSPSSGQWKIYALFEGWHGKMVERAGPGGEGPVIDHFSNAALKHYLHRFDSAFKGHRTSSLRAFFNDSYEVDDARGAADWTPGMFDEFKERRGYDLKDHLPALFDSTSVYGQRVLYDYRLTISEMLLDNFTKKWQEWAFEKKALVRNQAHGSPANILDLYSAVDIPEIEGTEPLRIRMASSAANVSGKRLVSSESATWLDEHFESSLGDVKDAVDLFLLNGVNHIFYHGTSYSPPGEQWPGWLFYAAVHLNPRNPQWVDFDVLNNYVTRCQSLLQNRDADNDILLYYPIADPMSKFGPEMIEHFDGIGNQFKGSAFEEVATQLLQKGYTFDFISDKQIQALSLSENKLIIIPSCKYIPEETMRQLNRLPNVVIYGDKPKFYAGFKGIGRKTDINPAIRIINALNFERETMADAGLQFYRKKGLYFIRNNADKIFDDFISLSRPGRYVLFDPMTGVIGRPEEHDQKIRIQLNRGETIMVVESENRAPAFPYINSSQATALNTNWTITFENGGPTLPPPIETNKLASWTDFNSGLNNDESYKNFSGTAVYKTTFRLPRGGENGWILDLGDVRESARVVLNGREIGRLISPPFRVKIEPSMAQPDNVLEVHVTNLMANRIADLDRKGILWKKFYNINFPARKAENRKDGLFDASGWVPRPSGLLGTVQLLSSPGGVER